jgi:hypothetical protein
MDDKALLDLIARTWVANGGDSLGFEICYSQILKQIKEVEKAFNEYIEG